MNNKEVVFVILAVFGLIAVRFLAPVVFYDPLIAFFHQSDYQIKSLPPIHFDSLFFSLLLRFLLNSVLTLVIIKGIFKRDELIRLTAIILSVLFVLFTPVLFYLVWNSSPENYQFIFYIRRILIHPILALILIPAYLYHQKKSKVNIQ